MPREGGGESPRCQLEDSLDAVRLFRSGLHQTVNPGMLGRAVVHWCKVLKAASQDEGAVVACPCGAVGTDGAKGDLVTRPVIASGQVGWEHGDGDGVVGQLNAEGA